MKGASIVIWICIAMIFIMDELNIGALGEDIACIFLTTRKGLTIIERNFSVRNIGEIDIIAHKDGVLHFVEVKSFSHETRDYRPEEKVNMKKLRKIIRAGECFVLKHDLVEVPVQIDVVSVILDSSKMQAKCRYLENI